MPSIPTQPAMARPGSRRLLILESDRRSFDALREALVERRFECEVALDLETARAVVAGRRMEAAIVNLQVAGADEEELIEEFKGKWPDMRLIFYNGRAESARRRRLRRAGADSYLGTGQDLAAVVRAVERVLPPAP